MNIKDGFYILRGITWIVVYAVAFHCGFTHKAAAESAETASYKFKNYFGI